MMSAFLRGCDRFLIVIIRVNQLIIKVTKSARNTYNFPLSFCYYLYYLYLGIFLDLLTPSSPIHPQTMSTFCYDS